MDVITAPEIPLEVKLPAHTRKPPARPGMVVHSYLDVSIYMGMDEQRLLYAAKTEEEEHSALLAMPLAHVTFYELPEGEPFFDEFDEDEFAKIDPASFDQALLQPEGTAKLT